MGISTAYASQQSVLPLPSVQLIVFNRLASLADLFGTLQDFIGSAVQLDPRARASAASLLDDAWLKQHVTAATDPPATRQDNIKSGMLSKKSPHSFVRSGSSGHTGASPTSVLRDSERPAPSGSLLRASFLRVFLQTGVRFCGIWRCVLRGMVCGFCEVNYGGMYGIERYERFVAARDGLALLL